MKKENKSIWVWSEIADEVMKSHHRIKEEECSLRSGGSNEINLINKYFRLTVTFYWWPVSACVEWSGITGEPYTYGQYDISDINYDIEIEEPVLVTNLINYDDEEINLTDEQEEKMIKIIKIMQVNYFNHILLNHNLKT